MLGLVIAEFLWRNFPGESEGVLTRRFSPLVQRDALTRVAATIGLGRHIVLSPGEAGSASQRNLNMLADACEAVIAAIYLDGGLEAATAFVHRWWQPLLAEMDKPPGNPKAALQEWSQARGLGLPVYEVVRTSGLSHAPCFTVAARLTGHEEATATASSKRAAEAGAAAALLDRLRAT